MQIHELTNKRKTTNEATGFGPLDSAINTGKAFLQNKNSLWNSSALASVQQATTQANAADAAAELANPGSQALSTRKLRGSPAYQVGGSATAPVTPQQQLTQVKSNPAVQQMVKNLATQWKSRNTGTSGITARTHAIKEEMEPSTAQLAQIPAQAPQQQTATTTPDPKAVELNRKKVKTLKTEFLNWARTKLQALNVNLTSILQNPEYSKQLGEVLNDIATKSLIDPESEQANAAVENFFNLVIATNQSQQQQGSQGARQARAGAPASAPGDDQVDDAAILKQYGLNMSASQLDTLASAMRRADKTGQGTIGNTGNVLLNALARSAGFKVAAT